MIRVYQILISLAVITTIAFIGDRFGKLGGIIISMPVMVPLTLAIVYQNSGRDYEKTAAMAGAAIVGVLGTTAFIVTAWLTLRRHWPLYGVILAGYGAWGTVLLLWQLISRLF